MNVYRYHSIVSEKGTIELPEIPLPKGVRVEVIILPEEESYELMQAAERGYKEREEKNIKIPDWSRERREKNKQKKRWL